MLVFLDIRHCCQTSNHQFCFMVGFDCADAQFALSTILSDSEATVGPLVIGFFLCEPGF